MRLTSSYLKCYYVSEQQEQKSFKLNNYEKDFISYITSFGVC